MKLILTAFVALAILVGATFAIPNQASAVNLFTGCGTSSADGTPVVCSDANTGQNSKTNPIIDTIGSAIHILAIIVGIASVIGVILSGLRMILANGDSNSVATARSALLYSLVGVVIAAAAQLIVRFILNKIG